MTVKRLFWAVFVLILCAERSLSHAADIELLKKGSEGWGFQTTILDKSSVGNPAEKAALLAASAVGTPSVDLSWTAPQSDDSAKSSAGWSQGSAPFGVAAADGSCNCATKVAENGSLAASLRVRRKVSISAESLRSARVLKLQIRFGDGFVAYVNGQKVASRMMTTPLQPFRGALAPHGPEWESVAVALTPGLLRTGENWFAVEVRPYEARALSLDVSLSLGDAAAILIGPLVRRTEPGRAWIVVELDLSANISVEYGATEALGKSISSSAPKLHHELELTDLVRGGLTHYRVRVAQTNGSTTDTPVFLLDSPPNAGDPIRFAVYGDVRQGHAVHAQIVSAIVSASVDFVLMTGDLTLRGHDEADWQRYFSLTAPLVRTAPLYPAIGNHEIGVGGVGTLRFRQIFSQARRLDDAFATYNSLDVADLHLIFLDSNHYESAGQLLWLENDLKAARKKGVRAIFAITHDGPQSRAIHGGNRTAYEKYVPLLARYGVATIFSGHDHTYERGMIGKLEYVVTGGGGAPLYPARCGIAGLSSCKDKAAMFASEHHYILVEVLRDRTRLCTYRPDGSLIESCRVAKLPKYSPPKEKRGR